MFPLHSRTQQREVSSRIQRECAPILSEDAKLLLLCLPWLGNVRELQNLVESIVQLYPGPIIEARHIQENLNVLTPKGGTVSPLIPDKKPKGTLPPPGASIRRLPVCRDGTQLVRNYCAFWQKAQTNYYIEEFAALLKQLLQP